MKNLPEPLPEYLRELADDDMTLPEIIITFCFSLLFIVGVAALVWYY